MVLLVQTLVMRIKQSQQADQLRQHRVTMHLGLGFPPNTYTTIQYNTIAVKQTHGNERMVA
jgi:hypothetical protein